MYAGDPTGGVPGKGEGEHGNKHTKQKCFHGSKKIQMAAMDSPLFDYVVFYLLHLIEDTFVAQKK